MPKQTPPQSASPLGQKSIQTAASQYCPAPQAIPHAPQFTLSVPVVTHWPPQSRAETPQVLTEVPPLLSSSPRDPVQAARVKTNRKHKNLRTRGARPLRQDAKKWDPSHQIVRFFLSCRDFSKRHVEPHRVSNLSPLTSEKRCDYSHHCLTKDFHSQ